MYRHNGPDGLQCRFAGRLGVRCLHCGVIVRLEKSENEASVKFDSLSKFADVPTEVILEELRVRGAEFGKLSLGGIEGVIVVLRDDLKVDSAD